MFLAKIFLMRKIPSLMIFCLVLIAAVASLRIIMAMSPRNSHRPSLHPTYIILHTTEGAAAGALEKLRRNGEAHYLVTKMGVVYRLID